RHRRRRRAGLDRGRPDRGHRRRPRQQGEPGPRRRAGDGAGRGDRRPAAAGRLRALGPAPADRRRGAGHGREAGPDRLRLPLATPLHFAELADVAVPQLDLAATGSLTFEEPDLERFACLRLALEAGATGGTAPCVLNAADEVAVAAFLDGQIPFTGIPAVI